MTKHERANAVHIIIYALMGIRNRTGNVDIDRLCTLAMNSAGKIRDEVREEYVEIQQRQIDPTS